MAAVVNRYNGTIQMADSTVSAIMTLNKLWIPDVLIDIIKDYLYIDAYTVWRKFSKTSLNRSIASMDFEWSNIYDIQGRVRSIHWSKGDQAEVEDPIQMQCCVCVVCGEADYIHTNWDGYCGLEGDYQLIEEDGGNAEEDTDEASYQDDPFDW